MRMWPVRERISTNARPAVALDDVQVIILYEERLCVRARARTLTIAKACISVRVRAPARERARAPSARMGTRVP